MTSLTVDDIIARLIASDREKKKQLRGSPSRDRFKYLHKQMLPRAAYALDVDLELIEKWPVPFIVARLDFKLENDSVSFTEALTYQWCIDLPKPHSIPVYLVVADANFKEEDSDPDTHRFAIHQILEADYRPDPPAIRQNLVAKFLNWELLSEWEMKLRKNRRFEMCRLLSELGGGQP